MPDTFDPVYVGDGVPMSPSVVEELNEVAGVAVPGKWAWVFPHFRACLSNAIDRASAVGLTGGFVEERNPIRGYAFEALYIDKTGAACLEISDPVWNASATVVTSAEAALGILEGRNRLPRVRRWFHFDVEWRGTDGTD